MPRSDLELRHVGILGCAADQTTVELAVLELKLTTHLSDRNRAFDGRYGGHEHVVFFASQSVGGQALAGHLLARRLDGPNHDRVGPEALDLTLGFVTDPFGDRQQPNHAGHADEDPQDGQDRTHRVKPQAFDPELNGT